MTESELRKIVRSEIKRIDEAHEAEIMQGFNSMSVDPAFLHSLITYTLAGTVTGFVAKKIADTILGKLQAKQRKMVAQDSEKQPEIR